MKKLLGIAVAALVLVGVASVYAGGDACCEAGKAAGACCGDDVLTKLNLTPDQQARVAALKDSTRKATSTSERMAMYNESLARILTPAQLSQWKADMKGVKNVTCPMTSGNKSS